MTILRDYKPDECDSEGQPLDWLICRACAGTGLTLWDVDHPANRACPFCDGHGSLWAAARAAWVNVYDCSSGVGIRCQNCEHPESRGTWEPARATGYTLPSAEKLLRDGQEPKSLAVHYSPCDEKCRHGGPGRSRNKAGGWTFGSGRVPRMNGSEQYHEASWRPVDVRRLAGPDLRPESLAVLCLRCWVAL